MFRPQLLIIFREMASLSTYAAYVVNYTEETECSFISVQQDASVFNLFYFCRHLYMLRVLTPEACRDAYRNMII